MIKMGLINIPLGYNYVAVFLTMRCNLGCSYCINRFEKGNFPKGHLTGEQWVAALNRLNLREDIPITLQGGEPTLYPDFIYIINNIKKETPLDVLTNLQFDIDNFIKNIDPNRLKRDAPYASIRVSYHPEKMDLDKTIRDVLKMQEAGFSIGVFGVLHPLQKEHILDVQKKCKNLGIDFRTKEFLGGYDGKLYGTYLYEGACDKKFKKKVLCKTTELIIAPNGNVYRCHSDLYEGRQSIGYMLDPEFQVDNNFRECNIFGHCNPCDVKIKTNRFQKFGHTSVEIKNISN